MECWAPRRSALAGAAPTMHSGRSGQRNWRPRREPVKVRDMPALTLTFVDDSEADHYLIQHAAQALPSPVRTQHFLHADHFLISLDRGELTQDALITDLNMPGPSGFDLIGALRDRPAWRHLPVLVLSTSAAAVDRGHAAGLDVAGYFVKSLSYAAQVEQLHDMVAMIRRHAGPHGTTHEAVRPQTTM